MKKPSKTDIDRQKEKHPGHIAMVMDLNKCIGCQTCTVACKELWTGSEGMEAMWWNIVNTVPGEGHPKGWQTAGGGWKDGKLSLGKLPSDEEWGEAWDFNFDDVFYSGKCKDTHLQPKGGRPVWGPNWDEDQGGGEFPNGFYFYLPRICMHCENPSCMEACPTNSIFKREEDGVVLINEDTCKGNRLCQMACPYKRIYFNKEEKVSQKCISCFPRLEEGTAPACVRQCPGRSRHFGKLHDPDSNVHKLVYKWKVALPLYPEFGTKPMVFYIPPMLPAPIKKDGTVDLEKTRVPLTFLKGLFGEEVEDALETIRTEREKKRKTGKSELMDILISVNFGDMLGGFTTSPAHKAGD